MARISIITPAHRSAHMLHRCLESVATQSPELQHIVVDGSSCAETGGIVNGFRNVRWVAEPDGGPYDAMNKGISLASGEIIGILNSDDYYASSEVLQRVVDVFADPSVDACYGDLEYVDPELPERTVRRWIAGLYSKNSFLLGWMPPHPTFFVRRAVYERLGGYRLDLGTAADYELMLRYLFKHDINTIYIPEVLVKMRANGVSNRSIGNRLRANRMDRKAWRVNGLNPRPWTLVAKPLRKVGQWWV